MANAPLDHGGVRFGLIDRAISLVSPDRAQRRYMARVTLANLRRNYEGAARGRGTEGWRTNSGSADSQIRVAAPDLRERMRDLVRNNPMAAKALQVLVNGMVGPGIRPRAASGNKALNRRVDALWDEWSTRCDIDGHTDIHGIFALAVREMLEGGDVFAIRHMGRPAPGSRVPLVIELKEADHLDTAKNGTLPGGGRIITGIEKGADNRRRGYWLFRQHPGETNALGTRNLDSEFFPAEDVAHLFERQRVQETGVPWGTPAIRAIRDVDDWQAAELVRKKTEACVVGIVVGDDETQTSIAPSVIDSKGKQVEGFEPGLIAYARGAKDIKFNQPAFTTGIYEWHRVMLHIISSGFRVPYELMTGDLSQVNFSSSRVGINEYRRMLEVMHWTVIIPMLCQRVWAWFLEAAWSVDLIPMRDIPAEWAPPKFESVNPWQDAQTDLLETRAGFSTLQQQIGKRGYDAGQVFEEWARTAAELDRLGLIFDSDPRRMTKAGGTQNQPGSGQGGETADDSENQEA